MKPRSLNQRLILLLVCAIALSWLAVAGAVLARLLLDAATTSDKELASVAHQMLATLPQRPQDAGGGAGLRPRSAPAADSAQLALQVWVDGRLQVATPGAPATALRPGFADGLASSAVAGRTWRVYSVSDRDGRVTVQAGKPQDVLDADMRHEAMYVLKLASAQLLIVGFITWWVTRSAFRPLQALGAALRRRGEFDLAPIAPQRLPAELHPFVASFNHLLQRLDGAIEGERRFIGDAAHELRTPLAALQAQAENALGAADIQGKDAALRKLLAIARRSTRLSEQLLDTARIHAGARSASRACADLAVLVAHVAQEFEIHASQHRRALFLDLQPCRIDCDTDEIGILLRNLLRNALLYTDEGGHVLVRCGALAAPQRGAWLEVADDGPGVPEAERGAMFERFHRVAGTAPGGTGIGLSLVAAIAGSHGASIDVGAGLEGRGLGVRVIFPGS